MKCYETGVGYEIMVPHNERQRHVVLVDPTDSLKEHIADELGVKGFTISAVESASECLGYIEHSDIDGVVSRYDLPDLDGLHLLRSIRISHPSLPFILHPQEGSEQIAGESIAAGVSGYVPNDSDPVTVVSRLQNSAQEAGSLPDDESYDRYRHLVEISPAPINLFDSEGTIIWGNNAVVELLGLESREELIGSSIFEFIHPDDHDRAHNELETVTGDKASTGPTSMELSLPDEEVRYIRVTTAVGSFLGTDIGQAVVTDTTEQKEREHQLQILDTWLRHNIRNRITIINGLASEIARQQTDDMEESARQIQDYTETLAKQADQERQLLNLVTSRPTPIIFDAHHLVTQAIKTSRKKFPSSEIRLTRANKIKIRAIPKILEALQELIANGIEHTEGESPTVEIQIVHHSDSYGEIRIVDNGPGIPTPAIEILHPDSEINQLHHGSGLGLVFASWVVRLSEGKISFQEANPRGSIVSLRFQTANE
jgi:PAS domain S-box-containing protein